jgi:hypothetical protein
MSRPVNERLAAPALAFRMPRMWVDVVCLRRDGVKLPPDAVQAVPPLRAKLTMDTVVMRAPADGEPLRRADVAQLWAEGDRPVGVLECAQVSRVGGAGLLVVGVEAVDGAAHPQAWWCRVVLADEQDHDRGPLTEWHDTLPATLPADIAHV